MVAPPWVIGHRGAPAYAPENTMASFRRAVELGATFIETDLRLSHDAQFVAMHDATLDRTSNGRGLVRDFTLAQLRELDAGSWYGPKFAGEKIPTLEEILAFAREADVVFYL
ncbi:MAG: glycerophosphodiester phosphodiesterase family protein, partial [Candidatus Acidiferrales bacterium]